MLPWPRPRSLQQAMAVAGSWVLPGRAPWPRAMAAAIAPWALPPPLQALVPAAVRLPAAVAPHKAAVEAAEAAEAAAAAPTAAAGKMAAHKADESQALSSLPMALASLPAMPPWQPLHHPPSRADERDGGPQHVASALSGA
jgi:hypothetical protein